MTTPEGGTRGSDTGLGIGDAAAQLGLHADTLRWFERRGVIPRPARDASGRRSYSEQDLHLIEVLLHLRRTGMPLAEIAGFTSLVATSVPRAHS